MPLATSLTRASLRELAGDSSFDRGHRYWRQGRVVDYTWRAERDAVEGVVRGGHDYRVELWANRGGYRTACTCPIAEGCKHAIALALHHLDVQGIGEPGDGADAGDCFADRRALEQFANTHGVGADLDITAEVLVPALAPPGRDWELRRELCVQRIRDVGSLAGAQGAFRYREHALSAKVAAAAKQWLEARVADHAVALAEEPARIAAAAPDVAGTSVAQLWAALLVVRAKLRAGAVPRSRAALARGHWAFDADALAFEWTDDLKARRNYMAVPATARLAGQPLAATCTCGEPCGHMLAAVDATLDRLAGDDVTARAAADEWSRPPWQRALAALAAIAEPRIKPAVEIWWSIERELGVLTAAPTVKRTLKKGGLSAGAQMSVARLLRDHGDELEAADRAIADQLDAWRGAPTTSYPSRAFAALAGHPRVLLDGQPASVRRFKLGVTAIEAGDDSDHVRLEPSIDGARLRPDLLAELLAEHAPGEPLVLLEPDQRRVALVDVADDARRIWAILAKHGDTFPPEAHAQLFAQLAGIEQKLPVSLPPALLGERLDEPATVVLRLRLSPDATLELEAFVRPAAGAPLYPPGVGPRDVMVAKDGRRCYVRRSFDREREQVAAALARLPLAGAEEGPPGVHRLAEPDAALAVVAAVQSPPDGVVAEWIDARVRVVPSGPATQLRVAIDTKRDWFGITGQLKVEQGRIELAVLLDAARRQHRFVRLDDHRWVELEGALRQKLVDLADRTYESAAGAVELSIAGAQAVRALADAGADVKAAPAWQTLASNLAAAAKLKPKPPAALRATLRPYQIEGHAWLARLAAWGAGACLADDMGLGKTIQAIALLLDRAKQGPAIVLAPTSVCLNWVDELARFAPSLKPVVYGVAPDRAAALAALGPKDILIVSYGLLVRDAAALAAISFATLVADEAQALKNPRTERAKAARGLVAEFRVALSGTPLENHLGELWSLFALVFPGLLGSWEQFRTRFAAPIEKNRNTEASAALARVIKPFLLRRTKQEVAPELPARTEVQVPVALSSAEAELYEDARLAAVARLDKLVSRENADQRRFEVLAALTRLRLLASHPKLYDPASTVGSSKLQRLLELVDELRSEGHRALVFSQFTSHLALVRAELDARAVPYLYFDGATRAAERARLVAAFQSGAAEVFLISLKAGGTGINLTGADYVIHLDPWWNPAVEDQATDRAHRIGQDKPVTVYRLIARNTVEEKILAMHQTKRALVAGVLAGTDAAARLTTKDLVELIAGAAM